MILLSTPCPGCRKVVNRATSVPEKVEPHPGDFSICFYCGEVLIFREIGSVERPTAAEFDAMPLLAKSFLDRIQGEIRRRRPATE